MKVYFDSCVWIDYMWGLFNDSGKMKTRAIKVISKTQELNTKVVVSTFTSAEIFQHFKDWLLMQKSIEDGFSYREFARVRKNYKLDQHEVEKINATTEETLKLKQVTFADQETLNEKDFQVFSELTSQHSLDTIDTLHSIIAAKTNCRYLITNDQDFLTQLNAALKEAGLLDTFSAITISNFLNLKK